MIADIQRDLAGLRIPPWAKRVALLYRFWMLIAFILGWFVLRFMLILFYGIVILPTSLLFRLIGRDPLERAIARERTSYWITVDRKRNKDRYLKKF